MINYRRYFHIILSELWENGVRVPRPSAPNRFDERRREPRDARALSRDPLAGHAACRAVARARSARLAPAGGVRREPRRSFLTWAR